MFFTQVKKESLNTEVNLTVYLIKEAGAIRVEPRKPLPAYLNKPLPNQLQPKIFTPEVKLL